MCVCVKVRTFVCLQALRKCVPASFSVAFLLASVDLPLSCMSTALQRHALHTWKPRNEMSTAEAMTYLQTHPFLNSEITTT